MGDINPLYLWLAAGIALMIAEAAGITGAGLLFGGLGAITAGAALYLGLVAPEALVAQCVIFFAATALLALLLWKPLQKHLRKKKGYHNMIGQTAFVGSNGLHKARGGEVTWSGTIMKARLLEHSPADMLEAGTQVIIVDISGNTLIVVPKVA